MTDHIYRTPEVARVSGLTLRQLNHWTATGMICPSVADARGSGDWRAWSSLDVRVLTVLARLTADGLMPAAVRSLGLVRFLYGLTEADWAAGCLVLAGRQVTVVRDEPELIALLGRHGGVCTIADLASTAVPEVTEREAVPA